jgi:fucose permease
MIMAIAGGALIPLAYGRLADIVNPTNAYWILVPCYSFILFYAIKGHKIGLTKSVAVANVYPVIE